MSNFQGASQQKSKSAGAVPSDGVFPSAPGGRAASAPKSPVSEEPSAFAGPMPENALEHAPRASVPQPTSVATELLVVTAHPSDQAVRVGAMPVTIGDHEIVAPLWFVHPEISKLEAGGTNQEAIERHIREWLGPIPVWRAAKRAPSEAADQAAGYWAVAIEVPRGVGKVGVEGRRVPTGSGGGSNMPSPGRPLGAFAKGLLRVMRLDPLTRWRARLAAGEPMVSGPRAGDAFEDPTLEGLAHTREREWSLALASIARGDAKLHDRVVHRLVGVIDLGDGMALPVWPQDVGALDALRRDVLEAGNDAARVGQLARAWLDAQPPGGAVVMDDAAAVDGAVGITFPSVILMNLADSPVAAWASRGHANEASILRLEPMTAMVASVGAEQAIPAENEDGAEHRPLPHAATRGTTVATVRVGEWQGERSIVGKLMRVQPPGLEIGGAARPLMADWSQRTFMSAAMERTPLGAMPVSPATRTMAVRLAPVSEMVKSADERQSKRWQLYVEVGGAGAERNGWELVAYFGPRRGAGSIGVRVLADGTMFEIRGGQAIPAGRATPLTSAAGTSMWVPVPASAIEGGKVLRMGLVWIDGNGTRSAWPRPMLPWQTEPGRIAIDVSSWSPAD